MPRRRKFEDSENSERWLLTYADLITLLLAFFIVMYSMSQVDAKKFGKMSDALSGVLKGGTVILKQGSHVGVLPGGGILKIAVLKSIGESIEKDFMGMGNEKLVNAEVSERGLVIHIMESALFKMGSAVLSDKAIETLGVVAEHLRQLPNHIRIEGHTDNRPIKTIKYPSNWELSSARATEVVRYFIDNHGVKPDEVSALGYGEFRPLAPNNTEDNRAKNRRVDIVVMTLEITATEPTSQFYNPN
ncbi:MAG: OmpA family protein [candidate division Zixibacteria bacterium]|nr:OmpA family protein [candidate division Zixibacteria bacterium]